LASGTSEDYVAAGVWAAGCSIGDGLANSAKPPHWLIKAPMTSAIKKAKIASFISNSLLTRISIARPGIMCERLRRVENQCNY
jgi:hypothetical protein